MENLKKMRMMTMMMDEKRNNEQRITIVSVDINSVISLFPHYNVH